MNKWPSIVVVSFVAGAVTVHELGELHPGVEHSHAEQAHGPGEPIGRIASFFVASTSATSSSLISFGDGNWKVSRP